MRFSVSAITQSERYKKTMRWIANATNKSWIAAVIVLSIVWVIALIPTWLYLIVRWGIGPAGFWEELALFAVACIAIGWLQGILLFVAVGGSIAMYIEGA